MRGDSIPASRQVARTGGRKKEAALKAREAIEDKERKGEHAKQKFPRQETSMSSFHPLGEGGAGGKGGTMSSSHHPLAPTELRFHDDGDADDDSWSPPSLPGDPRVPEKTSGNRHGSLHGRGSRSGRVMSPLEAPLDPLLNALPAAGSMSTSTSGSYADSNSHASSLLNSGRGYSGQGQQQQQQQVGGGDGVKEEANAGFLAGPSGSAGAVLPAHGGGTRTLTAHEAARDRRYAGTMRAAAEPWS